MTLPTVLPVFPLSGCILLPGNWLPLHVFEPRYRNMVADAMQGDRTIGMIQPRVPARDSEAPAEPVPEAPRLYRVGGAGRIERCLSEPDGRYHILLKGIVRFRIREELPLLRGYRRFQVECSDFVPDLEEQRGSPDPARHLEALRDFSLRHGLALDPRAFQHLPGIEVINGLAAALPFSPAEKQALLESRDPEERASTLFTLLRMGLGEGAPDDDRAESMIH